MRSELKDLLSSLEENLDETRIGAAERLHQAALQWQEVPRLPVIAAYPYPKEARYQPFLHGKIFDDPEKMLFNQLVCAFDTSFVLSEQTGDDLPPSIRADFGCVLIASLFGAEVQQVDDNPPWIRHRAQALTCEDILRRSSDGFSMDQVDRACGRYRFYRDVLAEYPRLSRCVNLTLPDLQGPFDNLELIRGSDLFLDMQTCQETFLEAMSVVTAAQVEMVRRFLPLIRETQPGFSHQHGFPLNGGILIRNDTSIMVSPVMYRELIAPFDEQILKAFGGGVHSCGCVDRIVPAFLSLSSIRCFDFGQSEQNDVTLIYECAKKRTIALTRVAVDEERLVSGQICREFPTGVSLLFRAKSADHAKKVVSEYKKASFG